MATIAPERVIGRVERVGGRGYGFILTTDQRRVFFHLKHAKPQTFAKGTLVVADIVPPFGREPNYRAIKVEPFIEVPQ